MSILRGALSVAAAAPYSARVVNPDAAATSFGTPVTTPHGLPGADLRTRVLGTAVLVFVAIATFQTHPSPGDHGRSLEVAVALAIFCLATLGVTRVPGAGQAVQLVLMLAAVAGSAALIGLQPSGPGFLGMFPAVSAAALRLPARLSAVVGGSAIAVVAVAGLGSGQWSLTGTIQVEFGVAGFFLLATVVRRLRESNERTEHLLSELEQTRAAQAQAAALGERQRLAREMHDVLAHSLSGLVLNLEGARVLADRDGIDPAIADAIERARGLAKTGLEEARGAIGMLRGDDLPGPERLEGLAVGFEADTGVPCVVAVTGDARELGSDARLTVYRVAQEALTNVRKHARAERVDLRLAYEPSGTRLTIEDVEGSGATDPPGGGSGYGLTGMRERAELLGGTFTAEPIESGFRVELWVPA